MNNHFEVSRAYLNSGNLLSKINRYDEAEENYQNALKYSNMDEVKSNIFMNLGLLYKNKLKYKKAEEMFKKADKLFIELDFVNETFELYINYGILYTKLAQFDKGKEYLERALKYFEETGNSYNTTICYLNLGRLEQDRANFSKSLDYFNRAIELCNNNDNLISLASLLYYSRGNIFLSWREYDKALADYEIAIKYAREQNDRAMEASIKNALAGVEADKGNLDKAEKLYKEIIEVFQEDNNIEEIVATYTNIALLYDTKGMFQLAQKAHEKALQLSRTVEMPQLEVSVLINLAELYGTVADTHKAIDLYNEALEILKLYDNDDLLSKCYLNLANIYEPITEFKLAIKYAKLALNLKEKLEQDKSLYIVYNALALSYDGLKEVQTAEKYYQKALAEAKKQNISNYYGILVNYGIFLFKFKEDSIGAIRCYDESKSFFEKQQRYEILIAINSNYAMIYQAQSKLKDAIAHYKKALEYAEVFISFMEDEAIMLKYRINFEHIYENLIELYRSEKKYTEAFYYIESRKSRTFSKILSSKYFKSKKIPIRLLDEEKLLKDKLEEVLNDNSDIVKLNDIVQKLHEKINKVYLEMIRFDERYVLVKKNVPLGVVEIKKLL
jgi:tetratricopeptide (TPR) repeat protein